MCIRDSVEGGGTTHHLHQLGGDAALPLLVGREGQTVDHLTGVLGGIVHGHDLCRLLAGDILQDGAVDLRLDVSGQEGVEDLGGVRLVLEVGGRLGGLGGWLDGRCV